MIRRTRFNDQSNLPSPLVGEGPGVRGFNERSLSSKSQEEWDRWEIAPAVKEKMVEIARQFRKEPTRGEAILWDVLRNRNFQGLKFRRQQPIGPFVVDFYCPEKRLIVEVDGPIHASQVEADRNRQNLLESLNLWFVRLKTSEVENDLRTVLRKIQAAIMSTPSPPTPSSTRGEGD